MNYVDAKTILLTSKHSQYWFGNEYGMNLYRGCCHGCIYCDSRSNCYRIDNFDEVRIKKDALKILNKELQSKKKKGVVGIGAMSDSYNPFEKEYQITRGALKLLEHYGFGVSLETKSDLITRDIDLFKKIQLKNNVILKLTITCVDDQMSTLIEPNVCPSSKRFAAVKQLSEAGLFVGILFTPMLPFISDSNEHIRDMVRKAAEHGAKFIYSIMGVTLRENQREYYYQNLDRLFPNVTKMYQQAYRSQYFCRVLHVKQKRRLFEKECEKYQLLYRMEDIINAYKQSEKADQMQLF